MASLSPAASVFPLGSFRDVSGRLFQLGQVAKRAVQKRVVIGGHAARQHRVVIPVRGRQRNESVGVLVSEIPVSGPPIERQLLANKGQVSRIKVIRPTTENLVDIVIGVSAAHRAVSCRVVAEPRPPRLELGARDHRQIVAKGARQIMWLRRDPLRARRPSQQRQALHPRRATVIPSIRFVAEVVVDLIVDTATIEKGTVEPA